MSNSKYGNESISMLKGTMLQQGYDPIAVNACYWNFCISEKSMALRKVEPVIGPVQKEVGKW